MSAPNKTKPKSARDNCEFCIVILSKIYILYTREKYLFYSHVTTVCDDRKNNPLETKLYTKLEVIWIRTNKDE